MNPVYDKNCKLVGWINEKDNMIFDTYLRWIGFNKDDYIFANNCKWVGGLYKKTFVDKQGKPVAWLGNHQPCSRGELLQPSSPLRPLVPLTPLKPLVPLKPFRPLTPVGGWSELDWNSYWK